MDSELSVAVREQERTTVLSLDGELDLASCAALERELERVQSSRSQRLVLDLSELTFMDLSGLRVIIAAHRQAERGGKRLVLAHVRPSIMRLLELTRATDLLPVQRDTP
jgi:anti-sigma B factor antagonist